MTTLGYLFILAAAFLVSEATRGRTLTDVGTDAADLVEAAFTGRASDVQAVLTRKTVTASTPVAPAIETMAPEAIAKASLVSPVTARRGSAFGMRNGTLHAGQDFPVPVGTPVRAAMAGTVIAGYSASSAGTNIGIQHANGVKTRYLHLSSVAVKPGDSVTAGQTIGASGNTGRSTGPHLHFEVIVSGAPVSPVLFYSAKGLDLGA